MQINLNPRLRLGQSDLTGLRFGKWTILGVSCNKTPDRRTLWICRCDCGAEREHIGKTLTSGRSQSCGCNHWKMNGLADSPEYFIWKAMIARCADKEHAAYPRYGGRGITVCSRWLNSLEAFMADMGERHPGGSIDRIDNDLGYCPENYRWATRVEQARNRSSNRMIEYLGKTKSLADWADEYRIDYHMVHNRLTKGWSIGDALTKPKRIQGDRSKEKGFF